MNPRDLSRRTTGNANVSLEQLCCLIKDDKDISFQIYGEDGDLIGVYKEEINPVLLDHRVVNFSFEEKVIYITISREVVY